MAEVLEVLAKETQVIEDQEFRMVTFSLGRKAYGIDIMRVKEISTVRRFTYVPNTISYVRGVFNLRGEITPVIDMRLFFNLEIIGERSELDITRNNEIYEDLIILTFGYINIGIIVDSISHVVGVDKQAIQRSHPLFLDVPYIDGIVEHSDQLYIILAMDRILEPYLDPSEQANFNLKIEDGGNKREAFLEGGPYLRELEVEPNEQSDAQQENKRESNLDSDAYSVEISKPLVMEQDSTEEGSTSEETAQEEYRSKDEFPAHKELQKSKAHKSYWPLELAEQLKSHFYKRTGNLNVWHADCGSGQESYSIAAALASAAPEANIQVRAADSDLLEVAKAPMQSVDSPLDLYEWLRPYLNKERGAQGYSFAKVLKDRIIFEYQDVIHSTPHTKADLIVIRDLLLQHQRAEQDYVLNTIEGSLKNGGLLIVGDNEDLDEGKWELLESRPLKIYRVRLHES